jgi:hypothetical protein
MLSSARMKRIVEVAAEYAASGALSSIVGFMGEPLFKGGPLGSIVILTPLPFVWLSLALLFGARRRYLAAALTYAAWLAAYAVATRLVSVGTPYFGMCLAGFVGGLGVTLADSICHLRLLGLKYLVGGALIGSAAALPFGAWTANFNNATWAWACSFVIWQSSMGTYLYAICISGAKSADVVDSQEV